MSMVIHVYAKGKYSPKADADNHKKKFDIREM